MILVGGNFTSYSGTIINRIARLNTGGAIDPTFIVGTGFNATVNDIVVQNDGKIVAGGQFTTYSGLTTNYIARLTTGGSIDATFLT